MKTLPNSGQCLCGSVNITVSGYPEFSVMCFCEDCQRISGGGGLPQAVFNQSNVGFTGQIKTHQWISDAGNKVTLGFCTDCGSPIYKSTTKMPDTYFVSVGLLSDQSVFRSPHLAYAHHRQPWDRILVTDEKEDQ